MPSLRPPKALFSTGFDDIATAWHKNPTAPESAVNLVKLAMALEGLSVAEGLIVAPKMSFRVYGENVVLCRLIDTFGIAGVEQLLEEDAIEFVLWRGLILHFENPPKGLLFPLAHGNLNTPAHCDPQASVELGLKGWSQRAPADLTRISKLAIERTRLPPEDLPKRTVDFVREALKSGQLASSGFDPCTPPHELSRDQVVKLSQVSERILEGAIAVDGGYDFHDTKDTWDTLVRMTSALRGSDALHETLDEVLRLEGLPNIPGLIMKGALAHKDIVAMRSSAATTEFREWLWSQPSPSDSKAVGEKYLAAMKPGANAVDKTWFKAMRVTSVSVVGTAVGSLAGLPFGPSGAVAAAAIGGAVGLATSLADTFGLEHLLRSANPRRFADEEIRPRVAELMKQAVRTTPVRPGPSAASNAAPTNRHSRRAQTSAARNKAKASRKQRSQKGNKRKKSKR